MGVTVVEQAGTGLLTRLDRVKAELGIAATDTDSDDMLMDLIERASTAIARETRRTFGVETVTETLDGSGSRLLGLTRTPVVEVTEVLEDSSAITDYSVEDADAGALYRANGWGRSGGMRMWGTEAFSSGYILPGYQEQRYQVTYRAGYVLPVEVNPYLLAGTGDAQNLPGGVEQACLETVKAWYLARDVDPGLASVQVGQFRASYHDQASKAPPGSLPASALGLLRNYYQGYGR